MLAGVDPDGGAPVGFAEGQRRHFSLEDALTGKQHA